MQKYQWRAAFISIFATGSFRSLQNEGIVRYLNSKVAERLSIIHNRVFRLSLFLCLGRA